MQEAIERLENAIYVAQTNEPINRATGDAEQADAEAAHAVSYQQALAELQAV